MTESNPFWRKLTKPIRDQHINGLVSSLKIDDLVPWDQNFTFAERLVPKMQLFSQFKTWVKPWFSGFDDLPEKYICNGNTDSLNHIFMQGKFQRVFVLENEYSYYGHLCQELGIELIIFDYSKIDEITKNDLVCISIPSAYNGTVDQRKDVVEYLQNKNYHLYIDVAYCGLTAPFHLKIQNKTKTYFAFTFSKTLSVGFNRISVLYSGRTIPGLAIMNKIGYINLSGVKIVNHLMRSIDCDYIYKTYHNQYLDICQDKNLTPTDCILFAHSSEGEKFSVTEFYKL